MLSTRLPVALLAALSLSTFNFASADLVINGSFEDSTRQVAAGNQGYLSETGNSLATWTTSTPANAGVQRVGVGLNNFANNGTTPNGTTVGFLQANNTSPTATYNNSITGLTAGREYEISYRVNARNQGVAVRPTASLSVGGNLLVGADVSAVGGSNPYHTVVRNFVASGATESVSVTVGRDLGSDASILIDDFRVVEKVSPWSVNAWNGDATSGIDTLVNDYTHAFNFGSPVQAVDATINGLLFSAASGSNPSVAGSFSLTDRPNVNNDAGNNVSDVGSGLLADSFTSGGSNSLLTLEGLTAGTEYTTSLYTVGFDAAGFRTSTFSADGNLFTVDGNQFGNNNGLRLDYTFTATGSTQEIAFSPLASSETFHLYGFANSSLSATAIPEPSSFALFGIAGGIAVMKRRRSRRRDASSIRA